MKRTNLLLVTGVFLVSLTASFAEEVRVWTSKADGRQFTGVLVGVEGDSISIRRDSDKVVFRFEKGDLVQEDLDWIEAKASKAVAGGKVEDLSELIAGVPAAMGVPAVGVLLIEDGETRGIGVSGVRKAGDEEKVTPEDKWHLGSCTKSMTATLAATFVEEGVITWETTVFEVLGKEMKMLEEYKSVTLGVLLGNRSGIPGSVPNSAYAGIEQRAQAAEMKERDMLDQRAAYAEAVLNLEPTFAPNTDYAYSNSGFVVAGAMLEAVAGRPWEKLMEERIFTPLGMTSAGFGNAARNDKGKPTQPWPHPDGRTPVGPEGVGDNSWVIGPAGTVHCSLADVGRYIAMHAAREVGPVLKKKETYEYLHTVAPGNESYARGWIVTATGWSQGPAISHDGSNTLNHCSFWVAPERGAAVAAFTNCGEKGRESCMEAIRAVVGKYLE